MERSGGGGRIARLRAARGDLVRAALGVLLLVPTAHFLAVAHEWLYFPWERIEEMLREGPLRGFYGPPILRGTLGFLVELLLAAGLLAWLRRRLGIPWLRAIGDGLLHLVPLGAAGLLLFVDDQPTRILLFAGLVSGTAAAAVFRALPPTSASPPDPPLSVSGTALDGQPPGDPALWPRRLAAAVVVLVAVWFVFLALQRHATYWSSIIDLGLFSGALRSTIHGERFLYAPEIGVTFLAEHFSPILAVLAPLYALFDDPSVLLVVQSLAVAGGGWLLYLFAEETLGDGWLALAIMVCYLLAPDTLQSQWHDFHMDLLMPPMIFGALLALRRGGTVWFVVCLVLLWTTKEDAFIYTALLGLYAIVAHRRTWLGLATVAASLVVGYAILEWVLPYFRRQQDPGWFFRTTWATETTGGYKFIERYAHLGSSLTDVLKNAALNPVYVAGHVASEERLASLLTLTLPFGFAAVCGGLAALLLLAASLVMLLASHFYMNALAFYYGAIPLCFAAAAAVVGFARIDRFLAARPQGADLARRFRLAAVAYVAAATAALVWIHPDSVVSPVYDRPRYLRTPHTELLDDVVAGIPADAPLSATGYVGVHLMNRPRPRMVPYGIDKAEWAILDLYRPPWPLEGPELWRMVERLVRDPRWGVVRVEKGVFVFRRGADRSHDAEALEALHTLDLEVEEWETSAYRNLAREIGNASGGYALVVTPDDHRGPGHLFWGPGCVLPPGEYEVTWRMAAEPGPGRSAGDVAVTVDVFRAGELLVEQDLRFADFPAPRTWKTVAHRFRRTQPEPYEFRVWYHDTGTVTLDVIRLRRVGE